MLLQPWAMLVKGPPCTMAGFPSRVFFFDSSSYSTMWALMKAWRKQMCIRDSLQGPAAAHRRVWHGLPLREERRAPRTDARAHLHAGRRPHPVSYTHLTKRSLGKNTRSLSFSDTMNTVPTFWIMPLVMWTFIPMRLVNGKRR